MTPETLVLATSAVLFAVGAVGALIHRHPIVLLISLEIMLNSTILLLVLGSRVHGGGQAQGAALLVLVLAAAEAVVGLALALAVFRRRSVPDVDELAELRG